MRCQTVEIVTATLMVINRIYADFKNTTWIVWRRVDNKQVNFEVFMKFDLPRFVDNLADRMLLPGDSYLFQPKYFQQDSDTKQMTSHLPPRYVNILPPRRFVDLSTALLLA